ATPPVPITESTKTMNDTTDPQPSAPPILSTQTTVSAPGDNPDERLPIQGIVSAVEAILRNPRRVLYHLNQKSSGSVTLALALIAAICSLVYGVVIGTFSGGDQMWAAPL